jgi:uncharacterized RDD family membrane protein YckC
MSETRVKITEIKDYYTVKRKQKNANGEYTEVEKTLFRYKEVPYVTGWPRFGHFLLDRVFYYIFELFFGLMLGAMIGLLGGAGWLNEMNQTALGWCLYIIVYPLYYIIFEGSTQASLGKLILKRVVVDEYGDKPTFKQIVGRSFARLVPFEQFSCFQSTGWHDDWNKTFVIRKKDLEDLLVLARLQEYLVEKPKTESAI